MTRCSDASRSAQSPRGGGTPLSLSSSQMNQFSSDPTCFFASPTLNPVTRGLKEGDPGGSLPCVRSGGSCPSRPPTEPPAAAGATRLLPPPRAGPAPASLRWLRPRRRSPPWHQRALPPHGRRHGHRWRRSGVYVKDAAYPGGRRRSPRRRRRPAEAALVNRGLGEPRMEVAVAAEAVGRALRRAGGKGGRGRGGPGPGSGASGAAGWAESRARGDRPDGSAGGGAAATRACGRCEDHGAPGTGVGMVTPAALAWAAWV